MGDNYRPSVNVEQGKTDALVRFLMEAGAFMPDDLRAQQGRQPLSPEQRSSMIETMNNHRTYMDPSNDLYGNGRMQKLGPSAPASISPEMLSALLEGHSTSAPGFHKQVDDALFAQGIGGLLNGQDATSDPAATAISSAAGPIDPNILARLYGQRAQ